MALGELATDSGRCWAVSVVAQQIIVIRIFFITVVCGASAQTSTASFSAVATTCVLCSPARALKESFDLKIRLGLRAASPNQAQAANRIRRPSVEKHGDYFLVVVSCVGVLEVCFLF